MDNDWLDCNSGVLGFDHRPSWVSQRDWNKVIEDHDCDKEMGNSRKNGAIVIVPGKIEALEKNYNYYIHYKIYKL